MAANKNQLPVLNIGRLSTRRYKFGFSSEAGTAFVEISLNRPFEAADPESSEEEKQREALEKLKRVIQEFAVHLESYD